MNLKIPVWVFIPCYILISFSCNKVEVNSSASSSSGIKFYGNQYGEILKSFGETADGGYLFGGYTNASNDTGGGGQGFIQKCDKNGTPEWYQTYGGAGIVNFFYVVRQTSDGGYIAAGSTSTNGYSSAGAYLVKTDAHGVLSWQKSFGANIYGAYFNDVKETPDHGFVAVGFSYAIDENPLIVVKTDKNGNSLWTKKFRSEE